MKIEYKVKTFVGEKDIEMGLNLLELEGWKPDQYFFTPRTGYNQYSGMYSDSLMVVATRAIKTTETNMKAV